MRQVDDESQLAYWQRKNRELRFLRRFGESTSADDVSDLPGFLAAVRSVREDIRRAQVVHTAGLFETSLDGVNRYEGAFGEVSFRYQRYDLERTDLDWPATLYGRPGLGRATDGLFFSSGMSAIGAALHVIAASGWRRIRISRTAYFETLQLGQRFFPGLDLLESDQDASVAPDVLWLDTSSTEPPMSLLSDHHPRLIVVDTSNVEASSTELDDWLEAAARLRIPLLLARSHLKLDTFGLELGRLGSIVAIAPAEDEADIAPLMRGLRQASAGLGLGFEIGNVYPWLGRPEFFDLSARRTAAIRRSTDIVAAAVEAARSETDRFEVVRPDHRMFFLIRTTLNFPDDPASPSLSPSRILSDRCREEGHPAVAGNSFGLDRLVFLDYLDMHDGEHHVRVSGADVPPDSLAPIGRSIRDVIAAMVDA